MYKSANLKRKNKNVKQFRLIAVFVTINLFIIHNYVMEAKLINTYLNRSLICLKELLRY